MNLGTVIILALLVLMIPIGAGAIATRRATLKWKELLLMGGIAGLPLLGVLAIQGLIRPMSATIVLGVLTGHILTHLDDD